MTRCCALTNTMISMTMKRALCAPMAPPATNKPRASSFLLPCSGSGKSSVGACLQQMGWQIIDADQVYHQLLKLDRNLTRTVLNQFPAVAGPDGTVDRKALSRIVFEDRMELRRLNAITHPAVKREQARIRLASQPDRQFYEALCDILIENDGDEEALCRNLKESLPQMEEAEKK